MSFQPPRGPGSPFISLFDDEGSHGLALPPAFRPIYGRWLLPPPADHPYTYVNFVTSRDGRVSFNEPGKRSGGPISGYSRHDRWLMGLLRARADAVLLGASALDHAPRHTWTAEAIFADDAAAWAGLRQAEARAGIPLHVITTRSGAIRSQSPVLTNPAIPALVVSTNEGLKRAREQVGDAPNITFLALGESINYRSLLRRLGELYGVKTVLSEAGPRVYGALIEAGVVDDEFLTLSPILVGNSAEQPRPGLIEGIVFDPDQAPHSRLLSVYRSGNFLFLHSRYR